MLGYNSPDGYPPPFDSWISVVNEIYAFPFDNIRMRFSGKAIQMAFSPPVQFMTSSLLTTLVILLMYLES